MVIRSIVPPSFFCSASPMFPKALPVWLLQYSHSLFLSSSYNVPPPPVFSGPAIKLVPQGFPVWYSSWSPRHVLFSTQISPHRLPVCSSICPPVTSCQALKSVLLYLPVQHSNLSPRVFGFSTPICPPGSSDLAFQLVPLSIIGQIRR